MIATSAQTNKRGQRENEPESDTLTWSLETHKQVKYLQVKQCKWQQRETHGDYRMKSKKKR